MSSSQPGSASTSRSNSIDETASNNYHSLNRSSNSSSGGSNSNSNRNSEGGGSDLSLDDEEGVIQERFAISNEEDAAIALQAAVKKWKAVKHYKKWRKLLTRCYIMMLLESRGLL